MREIEQFQVSGNAAERYERDIVPTIFVPWAADLLERAALQSGERVLDVACGTGVVARHAAQQLGTNGKVTGIDLNPVMLEVARAQAARSDVIVEWHQGEAGALPFDDATFDVVLCQQGLQFFPDKVGALREMHRVLVPGGRVVISVVRSLEHNPLMRAQYDPVTQYLGPEAARVVSAICALGDADELQRFHTEAGFQDICIDRTSDSLKKIDIRSVHA